MKKIIDMISLLVFIIYVTLIFFITNYYWILAITIINVFCGILFKINIKKSLITLINILPFILFTGIINIIFSNIEYGLLISVRLLLVCNITYIFSKIFSYNQFALAIETIIYPLKFLGINPKDISLIITISIAFLPILKKELLEIKDGLNIKGTKKIKYIMQVFLISVFKRVDELAITLKSKAYEE